MNRAYEYLLKAAELGHVPSMEKVAFTLLYGNHLRQDIAAAKAMFERLAMLGSPRGQLVMVYVALCCVSKILAVATGITLKSSSAAVFIVISDDSLL